MFEVKFKYNKKVSRNKLVIRLRGEFRVIMEENFKFLSFVVYFWRCDNFYLLERKSVYILVKS